MDIGNGYPLQLPVPNLGALAGQQVDPAVWVQHHIYDGAGIKPGGCARVETNDEVVVLDDFEVVVMVLPATLLIVCVKGIDRGYDGPGGAKVMIPWHAVHSISAAD